VDAEWYDRTPLPQGSCIADEDLPESMNTILEIVYQDGRTVWMFSSSAEYVGDDAFNVPEPFLSLDEDISHPLNRQSRRTKK
jgi:hypothetical protein